MSKQLRSNAISVKHKSEKNTELRKWKRNWTVDRSNRKMKENWIQRWNRRTLPCDLTRKRTPERGREGEGGGRRIWRRWTWRISEQKRRERRETRPGLALEGLRLSLFLSVPLITNINFYLQSNQPSNFFLLTLQGKRNLFFKYLFYVINNAIYHV